MRKSTAQAKVRRLAVGSTYVFNGVKYEVVQVLKVNGEWGLWSSSETYGLSFTSRSALVLAAMGENGWTLEF